jgi:hypothetical protein
MGDIERVERERLTNRKRGPRPVREKSGQKWTTIVRTHVNAVLRTTTGGAVAIGLADGVKLTVLVFAAVCRERDKRD